MKKNKIINIAIYTVVIVVIYMVSLYICTLLKQETAIDFETITQVAGTYTYETTILEIPVSETIIEVYEDGVLEMHGENYPVLFVFPLIMTGVISIIVAIVSSLVKKISYKMEI